MKDLHIVLCQKERDVERLRREIRALLTVIPLLADDQSSSDDVMHLLRLASSRTVAEPYGDGMADLETYYLSSGSCECLSVGEGTRTSGITCLRVSVTTFLG